MTVYKAKAGFKIDLSRVLKRFADKRAQEKKPPQKKQ